MRRQRQESMLSPADFIRIGGMFAQGVDTKDIAAAMRMTEATVYNHLAMARAAWTRHCNPKPVSQEESVL
jgi:DNA-binding CsgD family transcriptional regulator